MSIRCLACGPSVSPAGHRDDQRLAAVRRRGRELVPIEQLLGALATVPHLGVDGRDDPALAGAAIQPGNAALIDLEVLPDQLSQQPMSSRDPLIIQQPRGLLDRLKRPLGVLRDPRQHPFALGPLPPPRIRLLIRPAVIKLQAVRQPSASAPIDGRNRIDQLLDPMTDQPDRVLSRSRAEHRRRIDDLLSRPVEHPELLGETQRVLERQPLLAVQQQPSAVLRQRRRMPPLMIDRQPQRDLPPQIPRHALHRLLIASSRPVLQQHHLRQQRRRNRRPPHPTRIALREVLITHDPITVLCQQREKRTLRQRPHHHRRIEHPNLSRLSREHAPKGHKPVGQTPDFFRTLLGAARHAVRRNAAGTSDAPTR